MYFIYPFLEETTGTFCGINEQLVSLKSGPTFLVKRKFGTTVKAVYCSIPHNDSVSDFRCVYCRNPGCRRYSLIRNTSGFSWIFLVHNCTVDVGKNSRDLNKVNEIFVVKYYYSRDRRSQYGNFYCGRRTGIFI